MHVVTGQRWRGTAGSFSDGHGVFFFLTTAFVCCNRETDKVSRVSTRSHAIVFPQI